jgi:hypothetical protein
VAEYYITPKEEPTWRLDPEEFAREIRNRWPAARIAVNTDDPMVVEAVIPFPPPGRDLGVALSNLGYAVYLDPADPDSATDFVSWYQTQVPAWDPEVFLFTEDYNVSMPLRPETSADEIRGLLETPR